MSVVSRIFSRSNSRLVPAYRYGRLGYSVFIKNKSIDQRCASFCTLKQKQYEICAEHGQGLNQMPLNLNVNLTRTYADNTAVNIEKDIFENKNGTNSENELYREIEIAERLIRNGRFLSKHFIGTMINSLRNCAVVDPSQILFILNCCSRNVSLITKENRVSIAKEVWDIFKNKDNIKLDISHYNAFLKLLLENEESFDPFAIMETLESGNVSPNRVTYGRFLHKFCQDGDIEGASKILGIMKEKGMSLGESVFNSLITGHSRANDLEGALGIIDTMKQSGLTPNPDTYGTLLTAYAEHGDADAINKLLEECKQDDIEIPGTALINAVWLLGKYDQDNLIDEILSTLKEQNRGNSQLLTFAICHLVHDGQYERAHKLFHTLPRAENRNYLYSFYPSLLVYSGLDLKKVVEYCEDVRRSWINVKAHDLAFEEYLRIGQHDTAFQHIKEVSALGIKAKLHYFFPIVCSRAKEGNYDGIYEVLDEIADQKVKISFQFVFSFLMPSLVPADKLHTINEVFSRILQYKNSIHFNTLYMGIVQYLLQFDIAVAASFVNKYQYSLSRTSGDSRLIAGLLSQYEKDYNAKDAACLLRQMSPFYVRVGLEQPKDITEEEFYTVRTFLVQLVQKLKNNDVLSIHLVPFLQEMVKNGIRILPGMATEIADHVGPSSMTPKIQELLDELSNPELTASINRSRNYGEVPDGDITDDRYLIVNPSGFIISMIKNGKLDEAEEMSQKLKSEEREIGPHVKVHFMNSYLDQNNLTKAEELVNGLVDEHPDFQLSPSSIVRYALALVNDGRVLDAVKALLMLSSEDGAWSEDLRPNFGNRRYISYIRNILNIVSDMGDANLLSLLQEPLLSRNFVDNSLLQSCLLQHYIKVNNIEEAVKILENLINENLKLKFEYKNDLLVACIKNEDAVSIEKIMDLSMRVHGELNSYNDLAFAFITAGKVKEARKIFETPGLKSVPSRFRQHCENLVRNGQITQLEDLVKATKNLFNVDRSMLYKFLLDATIISNKPEKALELWTAMQEENILPSKEFLIKLARCLSSNGIEVPFTVPTGDTKHSTDLPVRRENQESAFEKDLKRCFEAQNWKAALSLWDRSKDQLEQCHPSLQRKIVSSLFNVGRREEAISEFERLCKKRAYYDGALLSLMHLLHDIGDVDSLLQMKHLFTRRNQVAGVYHRELDFAYIDTGRFEERMKTLFEAVADPNLDANDIPYFTTRVLLKIIEEHPHYYPQVEELMKKSHQKGFIKPSQLMLDALVCFGNTEKADLIYDEYLRDEQLLYFRCTSNKAVKDGDTKKLEYVLELINRNPEGREFAKGRALSAYVEVLAQQGEVEKALQLFEDSLTKVPITNFIIRSLRILKTAALERELTFPYNLELVEKERQAIYEKNKKTSPQVVAEISDYSEDEDKDTKQ